MKGFSLIEILVVIGIFALLGVITTQSLFLSLRGARKSDALGRVKQNLDYAVSIMERQLRNASKVSPCPNPVPQTRIDYTDKEGNPAYFSCEGIPAGFVASSSASVKLTSSEILITKCSLTCVAASGNVLPHVLVNLTGKDAVTIGSEGAEATIKTQIFLRTY
ncbi:hypothetical protein A3D00_04285 [Candidatus Woesebacteria bacterium RIFCSPHIGHO2_02_FULL_38_9]|nr:MAG: hypothetical protein A3D00_04285 [Candidatus Woesebacteria bacterium RIFCSPHIGHO2_02_FULL_38_9]